VKSEWAQIEAEVRDVLLEGHRIGANGWLRAPCPFCPERVGRPDRDPRGAFGINTRTGGYSCFRCGIRGRLRGYDAYDIGSDLPEEDDDSSVRGPPDGFFPLGEEPGFSALSFSQARSYLAQRHVPVGLWRQLGIGATLEGRYAGRVVVPVLDTDGEGWCGFVARLWRRNHEMPAYLYPPGSWRSSAIWNHAALLEETSVPVIVVEGVFDALHLWPDAVALLGKCSAEQFEALAAARRPVAVVLDGDAHEEGWSLALKLRLEGQRSGSVRLPPRIDPDQVMAGWLREKARQSIEEDEP
jgi:hypothetical protein